jgi:tetratricopeptide (TPR) repeat protein
MRTIMQRQGTSSRARVRGTRARVRAARHRCTVALALAVAAVAGGCGAPPKLTGSGVQTIEVITYAVGEGETLASIADDHYGRAGSAEYLARVNGIPAGVRIQPGVVIDVPVGREDLERYRLRTEAKVYYNRGTALADHGELRRAAEEFRAALRIDPRFADAGHNLGVVLLRTGDPEGAVAILEQVVLVRPYDPAQEFALGKAYLDAGRTAEAVQEFGRVLALDPRHGDAHFARAAALLKLGRHEEAVIALDAYVRAFPDGKWVDRARLELERLASELIEQP